MAGEDVTTRDGAGDHPEADVGGSPDSPETNAIGTPHGGASGGDSAPRRTLMAAERTYLAWLRTGLGAIGVALAVGRLLPALLGGSHSSYAVLGAGYGVLGVFIIAYALLRARRLQTTIATGARVTLDWWALVFATAVSLALAVATIVMVLAAV
jgi:putative membrane protein